MTVAYLPIYPWKLDNTAMVLSERLLNLVCYMPPNLVLYAYKNYLISISIILYLNNIEQLERLQLLFPPSS